MEKVEFLTVNPEKCVGCTLCEYACSLKKTEEFNPLKSRILVVRMHPFVNLAITCKLCEDPPCIKSCRRNALTQSIETRVILVNNKKCDGCGWCIEACPYGAIQYDIDEGAVVICDLCDGKPECKEICPLEAIEFSNSDEEIKTKWSGAYKNWIDESKKFIRMAEGEKINIFANSRENMKKIDEKLKLLYEKKSHLDKNKKK